MMKLSTSGSIRTCNKRLSTFFRLKHIYKRLFKVFWTFLKIFIHHGSNGSMHNRKKRNIIKQSDYDNAVTEWQNNPEASD